VPTTASTTMTTVEASTRQTTLEPDEHAQRTWMTELIDAVDHMYAKHSVPFIIIGTIVLIVVGVVLGFVIKGIAYVCMKYSCCEVTYNVNSPKQIRSLSMKPIYEPIPIPPPPPNAPQPRIDSEKKKNEERHPRVARFENKSIATRQQVMVLNEQGNIPAYTLRSLSADGSSGGFITVMNVDVKPKFQETEV